MADLAPQTESASWRTAGPDLLAFIAGLIGAAWAGWNTSALVWSLWLSSLVIGYVSIVVAILRGAWTANAEKAGQRSKLLAWGGGAFLLAFFTVHFGGFHWGHSIFLQSFFPVEGTSSRDGIPSATLYLEVLKQNAWFLPLALVAQRELLRKRRKTATEGKTLKELHEERGRELFAPYRNVVRLHLLIFFFAFAMGMKLPAVLVYVVVYAVYFFPWRILRRKTQ